MANADSFDRMTFYSTSWTDDASYTAGDGSPGSATLMINALPSGNVVLNGDITSAGDTADATFSTPANSRFTLQLTAVCDIAGATILTDGDQYYVFASFQMVAGAVYKPVQGFGHFKDTPASDVACFAAEAMLLGGCGPARVDSLRPGDLLLTGEGALEPIQWIGWRPVQSGRCDDRPVLISAGAFAKGKPSSTLRLSPNHSVLCENYLVPIKYLINERTVVWPHLAESTTYYHVELKHHAIVFANSLPVESFLNTNGRQDFTRQIGYFDRIKNHRASWAMDSCAPLALGGAVVERARRILDQRSR